jgi:hypothetical protein
MVVRAFKTLAKPGAGRNFLLKLGPARFLEEITPGPGFAVLNRIGGGGVLSLSADE